MILPMIISHYKIRGSWITAIYIIYSKTCTVTNILGSKARINIRRKVITTSRCIFVLGKKRKGKENSTLHMVVVLHQIPAASKCISPSKARNILTGNKPRTLAVTVGNTSKLAQVCAAPWHGNGQGQQQHCVVQSSLALSAARFVASTTTTHYTLTQRATRSTCWWWWCRWLILGRFLAP
jgi:hypothetical protein